MQGVTIKATTRNVLMKLLTIVHSCSNELESNYYDVYLIQTVLPSLHYKIIHAASATVHSLFILQYSQVYMELVLQLVVCLQFMYFQYVLKLCGTHKQFVLYIYICIIYVHAHDPKQFGIRQFMGFAKEKHKVHGYSCA